MDGIPNEPPKLIKPDYKNVEFKNFEKTMKKCRQLDVFDEEKYSEWSNFITREKDEQEKWDKIPSISFKASDPKKGMCT